MTENTATDTSDQATMEYFVTYVPYPRCWYSDFLLSDDPQKKKKSKIGVCFIPKCNEGMNCSKERSGCYWKKEYDQFRDYHFLNADSGYQDFDSIRCTSEPFKCINDHCPEMIRNSHCSVFIGSLTTEALEDFKELLTEIQKNYFDGIFYLRSSEDIRGFTPQERLKHNQAIKRYGLEVQCDSRYDIRYIETLKKCVEIAADLMLGQNMPSPTAAGLSPAGMMTHGQEGQTLKPSSSQKSKKTRKKKESIYEHEVEVVLNMIVDSVLCGKLPPAEAEKMTSTAASFVQYLKKYNDKFKNTNAKDIANSLTNRSNAWKNKKVTLARMDGKTPPGLKDVPDDGESGTKAGTRQPHTTRSLSGYNIAESGRLDCADAVEKCFDAYILAGRIPSSPMEVAEWIQENVPKYEDKDIGRIENGVKYGDHWRNRRQHFY